MPKIGRYEITKVRGEVEIEDTSDEPTYAHYVYLNEEELNGCIEVFYGTDIEGLITHGDFDEQVKERARDLDWRHVDDRG